MPYSRGSELSTVYERARTSGYGFVASNITETNILTGLVRGAERVDSDLVVQVKRDTAAFAGNGDPHTGLDILATHVEKLGEDADVGVFLNVDHVPADDRAFLESCVASGVPSSLMVDASHEPFEENVSRTRDVVETVRNREQDMLVEAELGMIKGIEGGVETTEAYYTDPEQAVEFVDRTGVDLLAISIGTEHGVSKGRDLELRPDIARDVGQALADHGLDTPLVVHGSSGLSDRQVQDLLSTGVCKLNKNTRYQYEFARTACEFYRDHESSILPPEGVDDDRQGFFGDAEWSPNKRDFTPHRVCREVQDRIADVMTEVAALSGSAGESLYV
ncbi:class II fructose-bisphosphate aldolase [Haloferax sulfurifontis]|uniref:Fructose/tagatose-1,6-bisphosphate aldolase n=1 Tax=Haloferax sulfurifontis ATCC BAA-897 TaxID=662480 RepID=M0IHY6_9EURY|nr:class II fructose-bisphosphate aldolase [Haloferax sulfurifontis]ELZ96391.1 fructose/tagatose-1,6-bisphosphate aldolase [Haloferax sulfurifontis ATCC BAA-897]